MADPNPIAYLMLLIWPLVAWQLWVRLDPARALIWTILGGYLVLPPIAAFNLPMVPDLTKVSIPNLSALALAVFLLRDRIAVLPASVLGKGLIGLFVMSPFATVLTNSDPIPLQDSTIPAMRIYDSVAVVANQAIALLPFFLARKYLATESAMRALLVALVVAGLAYSVPMLIEARLSPQINVWVYGFFQHDFLQTMRGSGFRPVVFLPHGLWVAFFALMCALAALALFRQGPAMSRPRLAVAAVWLAGMILVCKSLGPIVYFVALAPLMLLAPRRAQVLLAAALAVIVIAYPLLRGAHVIPVAEITAMAERVSPDRAQSFAYRVANEEVLLDRANERPWFGWGGYARNLIHDPVTGRIVTVTDGSWIILMGIYGWLGYIAEFGLIALPLLLLGREALARRGAVFALPVTAVALILAANMVDMLPNATQIPFTWLMAGALLGHAEALAAARRKAAIDRHRAAAGFDAGPRTVI